MRGGGLWLAAFSIALLALLHGSSLIEGERLVGAHANQIRSSPPPNAELEEPPDRVIVWFSEPVEASFSEISVLDTAGSRVDLGDSALDPTEPTALLVGLPPDLPDGSYTVSWRNLSSVDGHKVRGSFVFAIGVPLDPELVHDDQPLLQSAADPWLRWAVLVGLSLLVGGLVFEALVTGPSLGNANAGSAAGRAATRLSGRLLVIAAIGAGLAALGSLGQLLQQVSITHEVPWHSALGAHGRAVLLESTWGRQWILRTALIALAGLALLIAGRSRRAAGEEEPRGLLTDTVFGLASLMMGIAALFTITLSSHSAATPSDVRTMAVITDLAHIVAAAIWVGGLAYMALALPLLWRGMTGDERRAALSSMTPRFSTVAMLSAGVLVVSGIFSGWMQVTIPAAANTPYGWALIAKVALMLPLLGIAAFNSFRLRPVLASDDRAVSLLRRMVRWEALVAVLVLLAVGWLASLEPARQYAGRKGIGVEEGISFADVQEGVDVRLAVQPASTGANAISIELRDRRGDPIDNASDVRIRAVFLDQDLGGDLISAIDRGGGVWSVEDIPLSLSGLWQVEATVIRPDGFDARTSFRFEVNPGAGATDAIRPSQEPTTVLFAVQLLLVGALAIAVLAPGARGSLTRVAGYAGPGMAVAAIGVALLVNVQFTRIGLPERLVNPFPVTSESVAQGRATYASHCSTCHGQSGRGDGPGAAALNPQPADLAVHVPLHSDADLYVFIRDGIPGSTMTAFSDRLTREEMWRLVNYLRTFEE